MIFYGSTFSFWWLRSPVTHVTAGGQSHRIVRFQFNWLSWHTEPIWRPAFWFMEHVCGYHEGGFAAMHEESIYQFIK